MKKTDLEVGGTYALYTGYGDYNRQSRYSVRDRDRHVAKVEIREFDWVNPKSKTDWRVKKEPQTRVKVLKAPRDSGGYYKRGSIHGVKNKDLIAPWDEYAHEQSEKAIWDTFQEARRAADQEASGAIKDAWTSYVEQLGLPESISLEPGHVGNFLPDEYGRPGPGDFIRLVLEAVARDERPGGPAIEEVWATARNAEEKRWSAVEAAIRTRNEALREAGFEAPDDTPEDYD